ncbi:MAG: nuclear transport factor 2 family protein [Halioglobus sp.]|nr:nuclear transport factor 2 family protein [Halioglobus sp.]
MPGNAQIIDGFIQAWNNLDMEAIMDHFTEDAEYANVPMGPPNVGKAAIRAFIEGFLGTTTEIQFVVHHQVEGATGVVMNERTDKLVMDGRTVELPVMGVFEFRDGKICAWRDYFDMGGFA